MSYVTVDIALTYVTSAKQSEDKVCCKIKRPERPWKKKSYIIKAILKPKNEILSRPLQI